jgi:hypothetical protein
MTAPGLNPPTSRSTSESGALEIALSRGVSSMDRR